MSQPNLKSIVIINLCFRYNLWQYRDKPFILSSSRLEGSPF